jgi:hypothetical protein
MLKYTELQFYLFFKRVETLCMILRKIMDWVGPRTEEWGIWTCEENE